MIAALHYIKWFGFIVHFLVFKHLNPINTVRVVHSKTGADFSLISNSGVMYLLIVRDFLPYFA